MAAGTEEIATRLADAAGRWLATLEPAQRDRATFPFDSTERFVWDYRPGERRGLPLGDMSPAQSDAAMAILDAGLSERGAREVRAVIALEPILGELERQAGRGNWLRRDRGLYWFAIFGEPGLADEPWGWRVGGHHVAIQATVAGGRVVGAAPSFLGANPATVPSGPHGGSRAIDGEERLARALLASLTPAQRRIAVVDPVAPPDILSGNGHHAELREVPTGIRADQLETAQRDGLEALIRHYLDRAAPDVAAAEWQRVTDAGLDPVTFAWAGPDVPGQGHYYAVRGPSLLLEYDNTQDRANHIHAVWRDPANDWGEDLLRAHYAAAHQR